MNEQGSNRMTCAHASPGPGCPECRMERIAALKAKMEQDRSDDKVPAPSAPGTYVPRPSGSAAATVRPTPPVVRTPATGMEPCPVCGATMLSARNGMEHPQGSKCMFNGTFIGEMTQTYTSWNWRRQNG